MRRCSRNNKGVVGITFAVALLVSSFLPPKLLVAVLAVWVIILGIACSKN